MGHFCHILIRETKELFGFFFFFFSSLITPHSIFATHHSSLIIHHSSLKISQFPIPIRLAHFTELLITQFFYFFVGPILVNWSDLSIKPNCGIHSPPFSLFSFPLHPCYSPKTQTRTHKNFKSLKLIHVCILDLEKFVSWFFFFFNRSKTSLPGHEV